MEFNAFGEDYFAAASGDAHARPLLGGVPAERAAESTDKPGRSGIDITGLLLTTGALVIALLALVGWLLPITGSSWRLFPTVNPMIAWGLLVASISLLVLRRTGASALDTITGCGLATLVLTLGSLKLFSHWFSRDLGIDRWLFAREVIARPLPENLFSPKAALAFLLVGGALLLLRTAKNYRLGEILSFFVALIGVLNLQGSAFGLQSLHVAPGIIPMTHFTGLAFTFLGVALLLAQPERGAMRIIASDTAGGVLARRLLPLAIVLPLGLGALRLAGEKQGMYDAPLGVALFTTAFMAVFVLVVWGTARMLHRFDLERQKAVLATGLSEERIHRLNVELEKQVQDRNRALESVRSANQELDAFSYSVSHDLRAPLRAISGFSKLLLEEHAATIDAEGQRYLRHIQDGGLQMGRLIDDLLTFSRAGRQALKLQRVDVRAMVNDCLAELQMGEESARAVTEVGELPGCEGDPSLLKQLWMNLLSNALKYSAKSEDPMVTIESRREAGTDIYCVHDNGAGFDMKYADKLFAVFQRLHLAEDYEGTGVGLALAKRIVERHGGRIWAEGEVDRGATFSFTLGGNPHV